jgi:hypothetical protein
MRDTIIFLVALVTGTMCGCRAKKQLLSLADFERYYTGTRWYWSKYQSTPSKLTGFKIEKNQDMQAILTSPSGNLIIYSELEPSNFLKSFPGSGKLKKLPGVNEPIFESDCDYTQQNPNRVLLVGFVGGRAIKIEAGHSETNRAEVMSDAVSVARQMYKQLIEKDTSKH